MGREDETNHDPAPCQGGEEGEGASQEAPEGTEKKSGKIPKV